MKKIIIAMAAIAAAFTMASCSKDQPVSPKENPIVGKSVITASIENDLTKAYLDENGNDIDGYKVFWSKGDEIFVLNHNLNEDEDLWNAKYKLNDASAGSTTGTFEWTTGDYFYSYGGRYSEPVFEGQLCLAVYPFDLLSFDEAGKTTGILTWKTQQTYSSKSLYVPMNATIFGSPIGTEELSFKNLGGLLRLSVKGTATIKSIELCAAEAISGTMDEVFNEYAIIRNGTPGACNYITLDCGENGVKLKGEESTDFYFSLPGYYHFDGPQFVLDGYTDVIITLTDTEDRTCVKKLNNKKLVIERSKITTATFTASEFKTNVPEGALPGKFSVSADKQVYFSQGNLYYDGSKFNFETNQYEFQSSWSTSHVSYFYWSKDASIACVESYNESGTTETDVFFTNVDGFKVNVGGKEQSGWRTLSTKEWQYLFNTRTMKNGKDRYTLNITYGGKMGLVLYPDDYDKDPVTGTVTDLPDGVVFLPAAGGRFGSNVDDVGDLGFYWSSTAFVSNFAYFVYFLSDSVFPDYYGFRNYGYSVRLITESK